MNPFPPAVFLGALLLFLLQPMIAKALLPSFGGGAAVWAVCMVFFQALLFLGYLYAHLLAVRAAPEAQARLHRRLLLAGLAALPLLLLRARGPGGADPSLALLGLLLLMTGLPYFTLSSTGPLLQAWLARKGGSVSPYRLYALSNAGSLLALLAYPVLVEPWLPLKWQLGLWAAGYAVFAVFCARAAGEAAGWRPQAAAGAAGPAPRPGQLLLWLLLAACPSLLLLAVTNHLTQSVAPVPFLWLAPLTLYLLSFIFVFAPARWTWSRAFLPFPVLAAAALALPLYRDMGDMDLNYLLPLLLGGLFTACLTCHGELARRRPHESRLTWFYLALSLGGAAGGLFVGLLAPRLFNGYYELPIGVSAFVLLTWWAFYRDEEARPSPAWILLGILFCGLPVSLWDEARKVDGRLLSAERNFYGTLLVTQEGSDGPEAVRYLTNGAVLHGAQFQKPEKRGVPTTYYGRESGLGLALRAEGARGPLRVGVIGLGAGTAAAYGRPGDAFRFYEINPLVTDTAERMFSFLGDTPASVEIAEHGDARLALQREPPQNFDLLAVDAFSGDSIPVHLLTKEAFELYFRHLKPDGVLAVHVSSIYLDLEPVVRLAADAAGKKAFAISSGERAEDASSSATWVLVGGRPGLYAAADFKGRAQAIPAPPGRRPWTDDFSDLFGTLRWRGE